MPRVESAREAGGSEGDEDPYSDAMVDGDEEDEFEEESYEGDEEEEGEWDEEAEVRTDRSGSQSAGSRDGSSGGEEEEGSGFEDEENMSDDEGEEEVDEVEGEATDTAPQTVSSAVSSNVFGGGAAPASSAFSASAAFTAPTAAAAPAAPHSAAAFNPAHISAPTTSVFGQPSAWASAPADAVEAPSSASPFGVSFATATPLARSPSPAPASSTSAALAAPASVPSPQPASPPPAPQGKSAAALPLQFTDFQRSFGQRLRRTRTPAEEALDVRTSLARYELVVPTDKFDEVIEKALYGH